jgi:uncharacterized protein
MLHDCSQSVSLDVSSDDEIEELGYMLDSFQSIEAMNLEMLNGFLAAISCVPREVPLEEYLYKVVGNESSDEELPFSNKEEADRFTYLLLNYRNNIEHLLRNGNFNPYLEEVAENDQDDLDENDDSIGGNWSLGFLCCIASFDEFAPLLNNEDWEETLFPMIMLAFIEKDIPEMAEADEHITPEIRECLVFQLGISAMSVYRYFRMENDNSSDSCCCDDLKSEDHKVCCSSKMVH